MLLNLHFLVVLAHIFFSNTKKLKIPGKVDTNTIDASIGENNNDQKPGETNANEVQNYQHAT